MNAKVRSEITFGIKKIFTSQPLTFGMPLRHMPSVFRGKCVSFAPWLTNSQSSSESQPWPLHHAWPRPQDLFLLLIAAWSSWAPPLVRQLLLQTVVTQDGHTGISCPPLALPLPSSIIKGQCPGCFTSMSSRCAFL